MVLDWDKLSDRDFENICFDILVKEGFDNVEWYGKSGNDRGRDIICTKSELILENFRKTNSYLVQCKKWVSRPPDPSDLNDTIAWADVHAPNVLLLMITNTLTSNSRDWLKLKEKTTNYGILSFEEKNFELFFEHNPDLYTKHFVAKKLLIDQKMDALQQSVLLALANKGNLTLSQISEKTAISDKTLESVLGNLVSRKVVIYLKEGSETTQYSLTDNFENYLLIAKELLLDENGFDFLVSPFSNSFMNKELIKYIESRFYLRLTEQLMGNLLALIKVSPNALYHSLFANNQILKMDMLIFRP
jgi:predicted transcriptional regulator